MPASLNTGSKWIQAVFDDPDDPVMCWFGVSPPEVPAPSEETSLLVLKNGTLCVRVNRSED